MKKLFMCLIATLATDLHAQDPIRVYAAGSLRSAMNELAAAYPAAKVEMTYGASGLLRDRIVNGETAEVFASANMEHPHALAMQGLAGPVKRFARNQLCALAAPGVKVDSASLLERLLDPSVSLGTSTPKADPSGDYAWQLFEKAERVKPGAYATLSAKARKLTGGPDSPPPPKGRSVYASLVAEGRADVFLTYCTNAREAKQENPALQVVQIPAELSVGAEYGIVLVRSAGEDAWYFVQFVLSPKGQAILAKHGFSPGDGN